METTDGEQRQYFPLNFVPDTNYVLIGRGRKNFDHVGNIMLRKIIGLKLHQYCNAKTKSEKSFIVKGIVTEHYNDKKDAGFIRYDKLEKKWYDAGTPLAREKVSQTFRDSLSDKYRSSRFSKRKKREGQSMSEEVTIDGRNHMYNAVQNSLSVTSLQGGKNAVTTILDNSCCRDDQKDDRGSGECEGENMQIGLSASEILFCHAFYLWKLRMRMRALKTFNTSPNPVVFPQQSNQQ